MHAGPGVEDLVDPGLFEAVLVGEQGDVRGELRCVPCGDFFAGGVHWSG